MANVIVFLGMFIAVVGLATIAVLLVVLVGVLAVFLADVIRNRQRFP